MSAVLFASLTSSFCSVACSIFLSTLSNLSTKFCLKLPKVFLIEVIGSFTTSINLAPKDFCGAGWAPPILFSASCISWSTPSNEGADQRGMSCGACNEGSLLNVIAASIATSDAFVL